MLGQAEFSNYVAAFNAGDSAAYGWFYAPDIRFRNGAGVELSGPEAIISYYEALKGRIDRVMEVVEVVDGERALCAALRSRFEIRSESEFFAGSSLARGDQVLLESLALYELEGDKFARIAAKTLSRRILRAGEDG